MVIKDIKARYTGSLIGPLWAVVTPLFQIILYTFVFSVILRVRFDEGASTTSFVVYMLAGLIPWLFFSEAVSRGAGIFLEHAHIIKKVNFPLEISVLAAILSSMVTFFVYVAFYLILLAVMGFLNPIVIPLLFVPFLIQLLLIAGLSFGLGSLTVFFRDISQMIGIVLNLFFFLTPIVYPLSAIPAEMRWILSMNPFYWFVEVYRDIFVRGQVFAPESLAYPFVLSVIVFAAGYAFFRKTKDLFKDVL